LSGGAIVRILAAALLGGAVAASPLLAQAPARAKAPEYDPKAEVTLKGVVDDLHESEMRGGHLGLHLVLRTEAETVEVHACPVRFMRELEFLIEKGDHVTVLGSRPEGSDVVVAREIVKGLASLILRDKNGTPIWTTP
jgi:hypothetical protein